MLTVRDLVTTYGKIEALKGVSLQVREGSITCVLGPNGAGKTTLMMTIAGVLRPRKGTIAFRGEPIAALSPHAIVARGVALVPRPKLLLMDEPSLGLAPLVVEEIFRTIAELHRDGTSILLVEQNAHMALKVAQHFYLIEQGRVTFSGAPGSLAEDELIRRAYLGSARA